MAERRRWDTDERFVGVADAAAAGVDVEQLLEMTLVHGWVAEDAMAHLAPWCTKAAIDLGVELVRMEVVDSVLEVDVRPAIGDAPRQPRVDAYALIGAFAEGATFVRETRVEGAVVLDVVTGVMPGDNAFATHGHVVRVRIVGE
jgi:hypothetical protein